MFYLNIKAVLFVFYSAYWVNVELFFPMDLFLHVEQRDVNGDALQAEREDYAFRRKRIFCAINH